MIAEPLDRRAVALLVLALAVSVGAGIATAYDAPSVGAALVAAVCAGLLFARPPIRAAFVIFGGLLALQSSSGISVAKVAYASGLVVCASYSAASFRFLDRSARRFVASVAPTSAVVLAIVVVGAIVGEANGHSTSAMFRDALPYALLAYLPLFVVDAVLAGPRFVAGLLAAAGASSVAIFTIDWLARRGYAQSPRLGLASFVLAAMFFAYAFARSQGSRRWMLAAGAAFAAMLATGTRSSILFLLAPACMILIPTVGRGRLIVRTLATAGVLVVCVVAALASGFIGSASLDRLTGSNGNLAANYSLGAREGTLIAVDALIGQAPAIGNGLGTVFTYTNTYSGQVSRNLPTVDTVLTTAARFGWIGLAILVWIVVRLASLPWRRGARSSPALVGVALIPVLAAYALIASPLEDKGLAFVLMLLIGLYAAQQYAPRDS